MKTKKMSFRIVTALLAVCMMLPLMPATGNVASATGARKNVVVDFSKVDVSAGNIKPQTVDINTYGWTLSTSETTSNVLSDGMTIVRKSGSEAELALEMKRDDHIATIEFKSDNSLSGYYDVYINGTKGYEYSFKYNLSVDGADVGSYDGSTLSDGETAGYNFVKVGTVKVDSAGTHKIKLTRNHGSNGGSGKKSYAILKNITFVPTTAPAYHLDMTPESRNYSLYNRTIARDNWVLNTDLTKGILNYNTDENGNPTNTGWTKFYTIDMLRVHLDVGGVFAVDFNLADDAVYDISAEIDPQVGAGLIGDVYLDGTFIGAVDGIRGTTVSSGRIHPLQQMALKSGKHTLEIRRTDSEVLSNNANCIYFWGMNFTPVESATEELIPAVFGNAYAFIRETEVAGKTEYKLVLVGAVYSTDLKRVGFCVGNESYSQEATGTTKVYKTINVAGSSYTAEDFGLSDDDYIFYREVDVNADDTNLEFYAYAVNTDDSVVTGGKRTIAQPVKPLA